MKKRKNEKILWLRWEDLKKHLESRPGWKEAHEANELEFEIIDALIKERVRYKLTQRDLAKKIGVAQSALARFESGSVNPTLPFLQKVASGLGLVLTVRPSR
jgi:DNA-binding XRE family transcriptional regulator